MYFLFFTIMGFLNIHKRHITNTNRLIAIFNKTVIWCTKYHLTNSHSCKTECHIMQKYEI